jgi:small-conductance mechanosensitive channel
MTLALDLMRRSVSLLVAREVEWCAEMARQFGYRFPRDYQVGVTVDLPEVPRYATPVMTVRIRLDHSQRVIKLLVAQDDWLAQLAREAHATVHQWLEEHPSLVPSKTWMKLFLALPEDAEAMIRRVAATVTQARFELR